MITVPSGHFEYKRWRGVDPGRRLIITVQDTRVLFIQHVLIIIIFYPRQGQILNYAHRNDHI